MYRERRSDLGGGFPFEVLVLKSTVQCPHVLVIKLDWRQDRAMGRVESRMISGLQGVCSRVQNANFWLEFSVVTPTPAGVYCAVRVALFSIFQIKENTF